MLDPRTRDVLDTLLPSQAHSTLALGVLDAGFDDFWLNVERTALPALRWSFRAAVFTAVWIAPLLIGRVPPLSRHDRPTRERALAALGAARLPLLRQMLFALKTFVALCYGADPRVRLAIGHPRPPAEDPPQASHDLRR